jgi:hypothetical protein
MYFLVNHSKQDIQSELVRTLYKETLFEGLLKEADDVSQKRMQCMVPTTPSSGPPCPCPMCTHMLLLVFHGTP